MTQWYRLEDTRRSYYDPETETSYGSYTEFMLRAFDVVRETPKGVWLHAYPRHRAPRTINGVPAVFVLRDATKRWACPTIEEAVASWQARKAKQLSIYRARAAAVEQATGRLSQILARSAGLPQISANRHGWHFVRFT